MAIKLLDHIHEDYVHNRRTRILSDQIAPLLPKNGRVLDIGCGDGLLSRNIQEKRKDISIEGIDVLLRPKVHIPIKQFDGKHLPYANHSFAAVMFIDVLHHTDDPLVLLREAARVSRSLLVLKDHTRDGFLSGPTLRLMDWVGNARHGVAISANYWTEERWRHTFAALNLTVNYWTANVPLYPWWASWIFGRSLHFVACLTQPFQDASRRAPG
ncbi:MAG TPA: class I SAM-dependent methyltransferase [Anaerolineales bacterium]|nr:class I SAM-dependent methyltransferase [Anaerolineales bacterium]HLO29691.1 class I SAM-dependent methyltransferase [Anaerolineales bacterium]